MYMMSCDGFVNIHVRNACLLFTMSCENFSSISSGRRLVFGWFSISCTTS